MEVKAELPPACNLTMASGGSGMGGGVWRRQTSVIVMFSAPRLESKIGSFGQCSKYTIFSSVAGAADAESTVYVTSGAPSKTDLGGCQRGR